MYFHPRMFRCTILKNWPMSLSTGGRSMNRMMETLDATLYILNGRKLCNQILREIESLRDLASSSTVTWRSPSQSNVSTWFDQNPCALLSRHASPRAARREPGDSQLASSSKELFERPCSFPPPKSQTFEMMLVVFCSVAALLGAEIRFFRGCNFSNFF